MRQRRPQSGFTYLMLLWWVALSGVMLMALSHSWSNASRREREAELVWRAEEIRRGIESYASVPVSEGVSKLPQRLEDLLEDRRSGTLQRHVRRLWRDPITGQARWGLVREAGTGTGTGTGLTPGGITGVHSLSQQAPLRAPDGIQRYDQWRFVMGSEAPPAASGR